MVSPQNGHKMVDFLFSVRSFIRGPFQQLDLVQDTLKQQFFFGRAVLMASMGPAPVDRSR